MGNNSTESAFFVKDAEGVLVFANDAFARLLRRTRASEILGKRSSDFFPAEAAAMLCREDDEILAANEPRAINRKIACPDGKSRVYVIRKMPVDLAERKYLFCFAEPAPEQAAPSSDAIPVSAELRARFFSAISHDVRTPLNAIVGYAQLLHHAQTTEQCREAAAAIDAGARNLVSAVDGVMMLLSPEAAAREATLETFNVTEATRLVVESYSKAAGAKNIELRMTSGEIPLVEFSGALYKDILGRLIENAVRYTPSGSIQIRTSYDNGRLTLQVKDQSRGMSPAEIAEVMNPQAAQDPNKCPGSSTLCLVVAKRNAEKLKGAFSISSGANSGTTISIVFMDVKATDGTKRAQFVRTQELRTMRIEDPFRYEKRILVVDDLSLNVRILSLLLKALGFSNVVTETSAEKALARLRTEKFNLVLTDLMMPGMDGRELLRQIRATPGLEHLNVYAVTADDMAPVTCAHDGFTGILLKPVTKDMLKDIL